LEVSIKAGEINQLTR